MTALSVLDLSPIASGQSARDALENTLDLARHVESLGYVRYWLAEHHNAGALACSAPEIVMGQVARVTSTIRVGSGGTMLPNHAPLKVAETFRVLHAFFPNRIDLGLGRAPGTDKRTAALLRRTDSRAQPDDFATSLDSLLAFFEDDGRPREGFTTTVRAMPVGVPRPDVFLLGSSEESARFAAKRGLAYAYAHHLAPADAEAALALYRETFTPVDRLRAPYAILTVNALVTDEPSRVDDLLAIARLGTLRFARGLRDLPIPTAEEARATPFEEEDLALLAAYEGHERLLGPVDPIANRLRTLIAKTHADELMLTTQTHDHELRKKSYELLAKALKS